MRKLLYLAFALSTGLMASEKPLMSEEILVPRLTVEEAITLINNDRWFDYDWVSTDEVTAYKKQLSIKEGFEPSDAALRLFCRKDLGADYKPLILKRVREPEPSALAFLNAASISPKCLKEGYWIKAAKLGSHAAQTLLFQEKIADKYIQLALDAGYANAFQKVGYRAQRDGDFISAVNFYKIAAAAGHKSSAYNLGIIYETGRAGVPKDRELALAYYKRALSLGYELARAMVVQLEEGFIAGMMASIRS